MRGRRSSNLGFAHDDRYTDRVVPVDDEDGDTTAAETAPAVGSRRDPSASGRAHDVPVGADADDSTVQQLPDELEVLRDVDRETSPVTKGPGAGARVPARRPMMTLLGTGPSRGSDPDDEDHESVTERAKLGVRVSASGVIQEVSVGRGSSSRGPKPARRSTHDGVDDSEERALASSVGPAARPRRPSDAPRPPAATLLDASPPPSSPFPRPDSGRDAFDPPTAQSFEPPTAENVITLARSTGAPVVDDLYTDESITTRGPPISDEDDEGDSVTTRAVLHPSTRLPVVTAPAPRAAGAPPSYPAIRASSGVVKAKVALPTPATPQAFPTDITEGTTKKLPTSLVPAEDEKDSVTTQAPGHLTNMLRVIAASSAPPLEDEDDAGPENRTAVMANRPYGGGSGSGAVPTTPTGAGGAGFPSPVHPHLALPRDGRSGSESALRVAEPAPPPIDHASLGVLAVPMRQPHEAPLAPPFAAHGHGSPSGVGHVPPTKPPSYAMLVVVVAALSVGVPIAVFYLLRAQAPETPSLRESHQVTSEVVKLNDPPRPKAGGSKPSPSGSVKRR